MRADLAVEKQTCQKTFQRENANHATIVKVKKIMLGSERNTKADRGIVLLKVKVKKIMLGSETGLEVLRRVKHPDDLLPAVRRMGVTVRTIEEGAGKSRRSPTRILSVAELESLWIRDCMKKDGCDPVKKSFVCGASMT